MTLNGRCALCLLMVMLWPGIGHGEDSGGAKRLEKVVLVRLDACCPEQRWGEAEENIAKELALQNVRVDPVLARASERDLAKRDLIARAREREAQGAMAVRREASGGAAVHLVVLASASDEARFRRLTTRDITLPDAAVTTALRAVEAMVAEHDDLTGAKERADGEGAPSSDAEGEAALGPAFGTVAEPDAFTDPQKSTADTESPPDEPPRDSAVAEGDAAGHAADSAGAPGPERAGGIEGETDESKEAPDDAPRPAETRPMRLTATLGGAFSVSPRGTGVRSGFSLGAGLRLWSGLFAELDWHYLPFGPDVEETGDTTRLDLFAVRGFLAWRFLEERKIRPAVRLGGGGLMVFAEGIGSESEEVLVVDDRARVGLASLGVETRFQVLRRLALVFGLSLGLTFPEIVLRHRSRDVAELGRPLFEWVVRVEVGVF